MGKMTEMMAELLGVDPQQIKERERQREEASLGKKAAVGLSSGVDHWNTLLQRLIANDMSNDRQREKDQDATQNREEVETTTVESQNAQSSGRGAVKEGAGPEDQAGEPGRRTPRAPNAEAAARLDQLMCADPADPAEGEARGEAGTRDDRGPEL